MSRPLQDGLLYFPHDVDASSDQKLEALEALYGNDGYAFYFKLLERIYRTSNGELDVSDPETQKILAKALHLSLKRFGKILDTSLKKGCFDNEIYHEKKVLTSNGIKKRREPVISKREKMREVYWQTKLNKEISEAETIPETTPETPQSKEKKRKSIEKDNDKNNAASGGQKYTLRENSLIDYYFISYEKILNQGPHPSLKEDQLARISDKFKDFMENNPASLDDMKTIIEAHFTRQDGLETDFNINHFATDGIMRNLYFKNCYYDFDDGGDQ